MTDPKDFKCCVDAKIFAKTALMQSTEATRYYLCGVSVEPAPASVGGVYLIATNGHAMVIRHDPNGYAEGSAIVSLSKEMTKATKDAKSGMNTVLVVRDGQAAIAWGVKPETRPDSPAALDFGATNVSAVQMREVIVDGSFPDWRRIVPQDLDLDAPIGNFDAKLMGRLAESLATHETKHHSIQLTATSDGLKAPVLARGSDLDAFGVLMPILDIGGFRFVPDWFKRFEEA